MSFTFVFGVQPGVFLMLFFLCNDNNNKKCTKSTYSHFHYTFLSDYIFVMEKVKNRSGEGKRLYYLQSTQTYEMSLFVISFSVLVLARQVH